MGSGGIFASGTGIVDLQRRDRDRLQEPRRSRRAAVAKLGAAAAQGRRLGTVGLDPRHRRGDLGTSDRPAGRTRHRQRPRRERSDQVRDRPRRSLRQGRAGPIEHAVELRLLERRGHRPRRRHPAEPDRRLPDAPRPARRGGPERRPDASPSSSPTCARSPPSPAAARASAAGSNASGSCSGCRQAEQDSWR